MENHSIIVLFAICFLGLLSSHGQAASFSCKGRLDVIERMICADQALSELDEELSREYADRKHNQSSGDMVIRTQRSWLEVRNACADRDCVKSAYETRLAELRQPSAITDSEQDSFNDDMFGDGALVMNCDYYQTDAGADRESISISSEVDPAVHFSSKATQVRRFVKGSRARLQDQSFIIHVGQNAECIFPSGRSARIKIGAGPSRPYGMCGADPVVYFSLWVNQRKVESRVWFAGQCYDGPKVTYSIQAGEISKCHEAPDPEGVTGGRQEPLSVCVNFPDIARFPIDRVEYPAVNAKNPAVGSIEPMWGTAPVCALAKAEMEKAKAESRRAFEVYRPKKEQVSTASQDYTRQIPNELLLGDEAVYDFDNDGKLDYVYRSGFSQHFMESTTLLVASGQSADRLVLAKPFKVETAWFLPCQMAFKDAPLTTCPPFSDSGEHGEPDFKVPAEASPLQVHFQGRYTYLSPFRFHHHTYVEAAGSSEDTQNYVSIIEPLPGRKYRAVCLLRTVPENF